MADSPQPAPAGPDLHRRHLRVGWWSLTIFLGLGLVLEGLHGFKVDWYLDVGHETRRHMWTLAHAHGTLLGLVNLAFAAVPGLARDDADWRRPSWLLLAGTVLLPTGFFLGGVQVFGGDPGLGIVLVPAGGLCLLAAVAWTAGRIQRREADPAGDAS